MSLPPSGTALITGGSAGLGRALTHTLTGRGWRVITDGRDADRLAGLSRLGHPELITSIVGDVADPAHRADLVRTVQSNGRLDLLVHNASTLGPLPMRKLVDLTEDEFAACWAINVAAPLALTAALAPLLRDSNGILLSISSDAAVEHYPTWGAYAAGKAALDHLTLTVGAEEDLTAYAVDPGDMRTEMHQDAFPGEDISDRPLPETVVPGLLQLLDRRPASGRYRAADFAVTQVA